MLKKKTFPKSRVTTKKPFLIRVSGNKVFEHSPFSKNSRRETIVIINARSTTRSFTVEYGHKMKPGRESAERSGGCGWGGRAGKGGRRVKVGHDID